LFYVTELRLTIKCWYSNFSCHSECNEESAHEIRFFTLFRV